jgi:hypothetical protein
MSEAAMLSQISVDVDAGHGQLPGGQPGALQQRAGLVDEHAKRNAGGVAHVQGRGGRAEFGDRERAGVAVRQHAATRHDERPAVRADGLADGAVLGWIASLRPGSPQATAPWRARAGSARSPRRG